MRYSGMVRNPAWVSRDQAVSGMAHFAGQGPHGATCGQCAFYGADRNHEKKCALYHTMLRKWGANLRKRQPACKYFKVNEA